LNLLQDRLLGLDMFQQLHPQTNHYVEDEWLYDKLTDVFLPNRMVPEMKDRYERHLCTVHIFIIRRTVHSFQFKTKRVDKENIGDYRSPL
jgi:hypothetical protein